MGFQDLLEFSLEGFIRKLEHVLPRVFYEGMQRLRVSFQQINKRLNEIFV